MKKFNRVNRSCDDSPMAGGHIHFERMLAFASESAEFTEEENAHFDNCRACRFRVFYAHRQAACVVVRAITAKAA
jgi:hypothetical protein